MDPGSTEVQGIDYRRLFPWVHLFRAFRIAVDLRKLVLAALAVLALALGDWAISALPFAEGLPEAEAARSWPWEGASRLGLPHPPWNPLDNGDVLSRPVWSVLGPAMALFHPRVGWSQAAFAWSQLLWALAVWAVFAGALTRMAAVQFATDERIGLRSALGFSLRRFLSFLSAPLLPIGGLLLLWIVCLLGGLIGLIPYAGPVIVGVLWFVALAVAFLMALIVIALAAGWPLMYAAISAEGSDAYDGFSRSYTYVFSRPWHYLWSVLVAAAYGAIAVAFAYWVAALVVHLAGWGVAAGMGHRSVGALYNHMPALLRDANLFAPFADAPLFLGTPLTAVWLHVVALLLIGFVYSYFWTAATIVYFLVRQREDAADLHEVFLTDEREDEDRLPLAGVAASQETVVERLVRDENRARGGEAEARE